jgi:hypothetical protein
MRTRSVGHACLEIETSGLRLVTDPWWAGPAYTNQWYPWPKPQPGGLETRPIDYLYLSHGHEDHLHVPTLKTLPREATVLVPEFLSGPMSGFLRGELGFGQVIELKHGQTVELRRGLKATCYVNLTDSILVLDDGDRVLVNANDALHASPPRVIDYFCRLLRERHPIVDTLFLGFSGASWFPNCLRLPGKDDRTVAREREQLFTDNFIRVVDRLSPKVACAYAASFVLVEPHNQWINDSKFDIPAPDVAYVRQRPGSGTRVHLLLPNDVVAGVDVVGGTTPRPSPAVLKKAMKTELREACAHVAPGQGLTPARLRELAAKLDARVRENAHRVVNGAPFTAELRLRDNPAAALLIEVSGAGARAMIGRALAPTFSLELRAEILEAALRDDYGIESIIIGYGAVATMAEPDALPQVQALLGLLRPRQSSWRALLGEAQRDPLRTLGALRRQLWPLALAVGTRLGWLEHAYGQRNLGARVGARAAA